MTAAFLDHLWQSTLFAAAICLMMPLFRSNSATVRFWLWFTASVKFLVPLSIFAIAGRYLLAPLAPVVPVQLLSAIQPVATPFSAATPVLMAPAVTPLLLIDLAAAAWALGGMAVLALWLLRSVKLRAHVREAADLPLVAAVPVKSTRSTLEPGLVGIWRPVILLPEGIAEKLSATEMDAVMAHELCHLRRRDNLLAAVHMVVEALFWFHPLVWWLGGRLMEEREKACDESVLAAGNQPLAYAEGILKVCRFYIQSPLACAAGVSAALETRLGSILENRQADAVESGKSALLVSAAALSVMLPLLAGGLGSGSVSHLASRVATALATPAELVSVPQPKARPVLRTRAMAAHRPKQHVAVAPEAVQGAVIPEMAPIAPPAAMPEVAGKTVPQSTSISAKAPVIDTDTVICRLPQHLPGSRFSGPSVCLPKSRWDTLRAEGKDISADGLSVLAVADGEKRRTLDPFGCVPSNVHPTATTGFLTTFSSFCF